MLFVGLKARYLASRRRDEQHAAAAYRALPGRIRLLRTAGVVTVFAIFGAVVFPLGTSTSPTDAALFAGVLQLGLQAGRRLLGRKTARTEAGP